MGLREELATFDLTTKLCAVGKLLKTLEPEIASELEEILADNSYPTEQITRLAKSKNWGVGVKSLMAHRRKECICVA
jgi:hypothetical protein